MLQSTGVDPYLTVRETVRACTAATTRAPVPPARSSTWSGLGQKRDTRVLKLSGGQQRRLDVAIALAGDPELLFLDEPTTGFDPSARRAAWEIVKSLTELGKTVFLTTHFMDEAQYLADRVAVIARGEIVAEGTPATIAGRDHMLTQDPVPGRRPRRRAARAGAGAATGDGAWTIRSRGPDRDRCTSSPAGRSSTASRSTTLEVTRPSLEDVYLEITGGEEVVEDAVTPP